MNIVNSKRGFIGWTLFLITLFGVVFGLWTLVDIYIYDQKSLPLLQLLSILIVIPLFVWGMLTILALKISVTPSYIRLSGLFGTNTYTYDQIYSINIVPTFFNSYSTVIGVYGKPNHGVRVFTVALSNAGEIIRALMEAAKAANPNVGLHGTIHFGEPPFGIFQNQKINL